MKKCPQGKRRVKGKCVLKKTRLPKFGAYPLVKNISTVRLTR